MISPIESPNIIRLYGDFRPLGEKRIMWTIVDEAAKDKSEKMHLTMFAAIALCAISVLILSAGSNLFVCYYFYDGREW